MKNLLVVGGAGQLGRSIIKTFKMNTPKWNVMNIDFKDNKEADMNYIIRDNLKKEEIERIHQNKFLESDKLDCLINVAGGWLGGGIDSEDVIDGLNLMMQMNLNSSVLSANLAKKYMNKNSLLVLTGANAVKSGMNPGMLAYHLSKQSVHHLTDLLVESNELSDIKIITILPNIIDTETNRKAMPDANYDNWTKPEIIAELIKKWADLKNYPKDNFYKV